MKYRTEQENFYRQWLTRYRPRSVWITLAQHRACLFLIRQGARFMIDFGYENATQKAQELRRAL